MPDNRKCEQLQLRVTPEEKSAIKQAAEAAGLSMSSWVLSNVLPARSLQFQSLVAELVGSSEKSFVFAELLEMLGGLTASQYHEAVSEAPRALLDPYWAGYLASTIEYTAERLHTHPPSWTRDVPPLEEPAFGSSLKSVRLHLLTHSPPAFSQRNIFINANVGDRA